MKCPILAPTPEETSLGKLWDAVDCLGKECAWWDENYECCSALSIAKTLLALGTNLRRIHVESCLSRYTYLCHYCRVKVERTASGEIKTPSKWTRLELTDGKYVWVCDQCSESIQ